MAYNVTEEIISLFRVPYRQIADIQVYGVSGLDRITQADIVQGGMTVDRYCFSSQSFEIGTAIASELSVELSNIDGRFDSVSFDGARLVTRIGIRKWDAKHWENAVTHYIPLGVFTVDEIVRNKASVTLNALDNMVRFDRLYDTNLPYPATLAEIALDACSKCGVILSTVSFYNSDYLVENKPTDDGLTYRQVIQWIAQISCTNAIMDWDGQLRFVWFADSGLTLPVSDRYESDLEEEAVQVTGVKVVSSDGSSYQAGQAGSVLTIEGNALIQSDAQTVAESVYTKAGNFSYVPYSATCRPMPYLFPMDMITFVDSKGNQLLTIVSSVTYTLNGSTDVLGEGDGSTKSGYASMGSATSYEKAVIEKAKKEAESVSYEQYNVALSLNQTISSSLGLYRTVVSDGSGTKWYYHDRPRPQDSTVIYTFGAGGFAWTDEWNNGNPIWNYGLTKDGNAIYKILAAYKIQAEYIEAGTITADKIKAGAIGGFNIDETHIGIGKNAYNDTEHDGVYIATDGIGLGKGTFYVTDTGFLHAESGEFSGDITGGTININDNFIVDQNGGVQLNGSIVWGSGSSPTQVLYAASSITKPSDGSAWSDFPTTSADAWHRTYSANSDYFASYTYDGGSTWGDPIQIKGINGNNGKDGNDGNDGNDGDSIEIVYLYHIQNTPSAPDTPSYDGTTLPIGWYLSPVGVTDTNQYEFISQATVTNGEYGAWSVPVIWAKYGADGSDAAVTDENVFQALTSNGTMYGCFTALDNKLYINAAYIQSGTVSSDLTYTGSLS